MVSGDGSTSLPSAEGCGEWTYEMVEARLVEAMAVARALPDRERRWLAVKACWPSIVRERCLGDYDAYGYLGSSEDAPPPRVPIAGSDEARMWQATGWAVEWVEEPVRVILDAALAAQAGGRRPPWRRMVTQLGLGISGPALRDRYEAAIAAICCGLNGKPPTRANIKAVLGALARRRMVAMPAGEGGDAAGRRRSRRRVDVEVRYT